MELQKSFPKIASTCTVVARGRTIARAHIEKMLVRACLQLETHRHNSQTLELHGHQKPKLKI